MIFFPTEETEIKENAIKQTINLTNKQTTHKSGQLRPGRIKWLNCPQYKNLCLQLRYIDLYQYCC